MPCEGFEGGKEGEGQTNSLDQEPGCKSITHCPGSLSENKSREMESHLCGFCGSEKIGGYQLVLVSK